MNESGHQSRPFIRFVCWVAIIVLVVTGVLIVVVNPSAGFQVLFGIFAPLIFLASILDRLRARPSSGSAELPLACDCRSLTLGSGNLDLDVDGTLRFSSTPSAFDNVPMGDDSTVERAQHLGKQAAGRLGVILGLILVPTSIIITLALTTQLDATVAVFLGWGLSLIPGWFFWRHHKKTKAIPPEPHTLNIPASRLLAVIPYRRLLMGPSIVVGYRSKDGQGERWEEFLLSRMDSLWQLPTQTAEPEDWVRLSNVAANSAAFAGAADRYRQRIHRREALAHWLVASAIIAVVFIIPFAAIGFGVGAPLLGFVVSGIGALVVSGVIAIVELAAFH